MPVALKAVTVANPIKIDIELALTRGIPSQSVGKPPLLR
jgi:hypothetical protein